MESSTLIHKQSTDVIKSETDLFSVPPTQTGIEHALWDVSYPVTSIEGGPIEFQINGGGDDYIDLNNTYLLVEAKITKKNGEAIAAKTAVAPVNNWLHSLFQQVEISMGGKIISEANNLYAYKAYLENLLAYDAQTKRGQLANVMWYKDTAGKHDDLKVHLADGETLEKDIPNRGAYDRAQRIDASNIIQMYGKLHHGLLSQERLLINATPIHIKLIPSSSAFNLMHGAATDAETKLTAAKLYVRKCHLNDSMRAAHNNIMAVRHQKAKYVFRRTEIRPFVLSAGTNNKHIEKIFQNHVPRRMFVFFIKNTATAGQSSENPYKMETFGLTQLRVRVDGKEMEWFKPDYEHKRFAREYASLFEGCGQYLNNWSNDITLNDYQNGFCLYGLDLTPDLSSDEGHLQLKRSGTVDADVQFADNLGEAVTMLIYGEFDSVIEVDEHRNVFTDY